MNDPHGVALFYNIKHKKSVDYSKAEPLEREEEDFTIKIENDKACFTMKARYATEEEARKAVEEYIEVWELAAALDEGPNAFALEFTPPDMEDRNPLPVRPAPGDIRATYAYAPQPRMEGKLCVTHPYSSYPSPPSGMKITPDVKSMYDRLMGYLSGKERLPSMAYFCLDVLRGSTRYYSSNKKTGPDDKAVEMYRIERAVIKKIVRLSSNKGGPAARKAAGINYPLTPKETCFLEEAVKAMILRAAEVAQDPKNESRAEIKLSNLPQC